METIDIKNLIKALGFVSKEGAKSVFQKKYAAHRHYSIEVDIDNQSIDYGSKIRYGTRRTLNFSNDENFVVLECVDRLLSKGYKPERIELEKVWPAGHGHSGELDICVYREDGSEYLLIECKTFGKEFEKEFEQMNKDGGQLFTYFKFSNKADILMLYASEFQGKQLNYRNEIVRIEDEYRQGDVKDFYDKWNKLTKDNGVFEDWANPYLFKSRALYYHDLKDISESDSNRIFNRFAEILRHNVVSDKPNAFNKIFTLFLCKIYDEKSTEGTDDELGFQWKESDDNVSFQIRLTDLYKNGMKEFLEKSVSDFSEEEFDKRYASLKEKDRKELKDEINRLRLEKNNEFAIKEVFDKRSFEENAVVVKAVVELLQKYKIRYAKRQQYLSDFFELLLTTGLKQEAGQFFTPVPIAQFIIRSLPIDQFVKEKIQSGKRDELLPYIIDYAAGSGHFLTESMHLVQHLLETSDFGKLNASTKAEVKKFQENPFEWAIHYIYGVEKDYRLVKVGKVGCYLHGDGLANVIHSDGLAAFDHEDYKGKLNHADKNFPKENKQFDVVVSNPPYSVSTFKNAARTYYGSDDFELYEKLTDNSSEIECLFIERTKQLLKDGGVAGIILPSSILSNGGIYAKTREMILRYFEIIAITELGSSTFMATGTNTVVLFLRRRNNYDSVNLEHSVDRFFEDYRDVVQNGIEKPVAKYVDHVWDGLKFDDYISLLKGSPNKAVSNHDLYKEYRQKIKAKDDTEFWKKILELEKEKLLYFILAYPQKVVLVKSGEKDVEKRFLGYEFSNRRGSEGIHPIQHGKTIDECTRLFDVDELENPEKVSTYIYRAFSADPRDDEPFSIPESLKNHVFQTNLVDMIAFDWATFEKIIRTRVKKKVKNVFGEKHQLIPLENVADIVKGTSITKEKTIPGEIPVVAGGKTVAYYHNTFNREGNIITVSASGANAGFLNYFTGPIFASDCNTIQSRNEKIVSTRLIYYLLSLIQDEIFELGRGQAQPHVYAKDLNIIKIPLPSLDVQRKIVAEMEKIERMEKGTKESVEKCKNAIVEVVDQIDCTLVSLHQITSKIGSGATPRGGERSYCEEGITLVRSQNVHDYGFVEKGLVFIDGEQANQLKNVTLESCDVLFNITGASVARCCMMEDRFLPARVNQHVAIIRVNKLALPKYVQQVLISRKCKEQLLLLADSSTTREAITKTQLEDFRIPLPPLSDQKKIVAKIEKWEKEIADLQAKANGLAEQKNAVLKKYL